jgi:hypothetical protein
VSQLDHTTAWATGGPTDESNLACMCDPCHQMKHRTPWTVEQLGGGVLQWTTPLGHTHITRPAIELPSTRLPVTSGPGNGPCGYGSEATNSLDATPPDMTPPDASTPEPADEPPPF